MSKEITPQYLFDVASKLFEINKNESRNFSYDKPDGMILGLQDLEMRLPQFDAESIFNENILESYFKTSPMFKNDEKDPISEVDGWNISISSSRDSEYNESGWTNTPIFRFEKEGEVHYIRYWFEEDSWDGPDESLSDVRERAEFVYPRVIKKKVFLNDEEELKYINQETEDILNTAWNPKKN